MKIDVPEYLSNWLLGAGNVYFSPNPGNAGDALIASATWQVFDDLRFMPKFLPRKSRVPRHSHIILGGGGNLVPYYNNLSRVMELCLENGVERCLMLPHTIRGNEALLARLDHRFTLICRDEKSLAHVREFAPRATALLARDMVTWLDFQKLEAQVGKIGHKLALCLDPDWLRRAIGWKLALRRCRRQKDGKLFLLRADRESAEPGRDPGLDLMRHFRSRMSGRAACDQVSDDVVTLLRQAKSVTTDRLHVALPCLMLGVDVSIIENSYGKVGEVCATAFGSEKVHWRA